MGTLKPFIPLVPGTNDLTMVGFAQIPSKGYIVMLSDGRVLYSSKREVLFVDENRCVVDGAWVYRRVSPPAPSIAPVSRVGGAAEFHSPAMGDESHLTGPDHRLRKMTIHYADGSMVTKLVEPPEPKAIEDVPNAEPSESANAPLYQPQQFGNGVHNLLQPRP